MSPVAERRDDRGERGADDDGDRQVDDVAPQQELLELVQHVRSPRSEPVVARPPAR